MNFFHSYFVKLNYGLHSLQEMSERYPTSCASEKWCACVWSEQSDAQMVASFSLNGAALTWEWMKGKLWITTLEKFGVLMPRKGRILSFRNITSSQHSVPSMTAEFTVWTHFDCRWHSWALLDHFERGVWLKFADRLSRHALRMYRIS